MITITGASGNTGSKITEILLAKGEKVRVIGRSKDKLAGFSNRGAEIAVGDQGDAAFLINAFKGSDAVYALIPPDMGAKDIRGYYNKYGDSLVTAIKDSGIKKVVFLSSLGADQESGTGPVLGLHDVEKKLSKIESVDILILRPGYFMENTLWNIPLIKNQSINGNPANPDSPILMIASKDIAKSAAKFLQEREFTGYTVVDLFGQKISYKEVTNLIGNKIGKGELPYIQFPDSDAIQSMEQMGLSESVAKSFVELAHGFDKGIVKTTQGDSDHPNCETQFDDWLEEVFYPAYEQTV